MVPSKKEVSKWCVVVDIYPSDFNTAQIIQEGKSGRLSCPIGWCHTLSYISFTHFEYEHFSKSSHSSEPCVHTTLVSECALVTLFKFKSKNFCKKYLRLCVIEILYNHHQLSYDHIQSIFGQKYTLKLEQNWPWWTKTT